MDDVIVVGAGPAGNNTAYRLASLGYGVTVVDWRTSVGDKLCTGIVGRECVQRYPVDRSLVYRDVQSATGITPAGENMSFSRPVAQAHVLDRAAYVASFGEMARRAGATYLLGHRVAEVSVARDHASVRLNGDNEGRILKARAVVLACGFGSKLASQAGFGKVRDHVVGVQAEVMAPQVRQVHVYFGRGVAPGFFAWVVPTHEGLALVGLLSRHNPGVLLEKLLLKLELEGRVHSVVKGPTSWGIPLRPPGKTFGDRILAVGDAAGQVKPTTGGGIYYALRASEIAAETLHGALFRDQLSQAGLAEYERGWKALLSQELEVGYFARRLFESLNDSQVGSLLRAVAGNGADPELMGAQDVSFDWHSRAIVMAVKHPLLSRVLSLVNPLLATVAPQGKAQREADPSHLQSQLNFD